MMLTKVSPDIIQLCARLLSPIADKYARLVIELKINRSRKDIVHLPGPIRRFLKRPGSKTHDEPA